MPAPITRPKQREIEKYYFEGYRLNEIATLTRVSRGTVARYINQAEQRVQVAAAPAATLTADDVGDLRVVLRVLGHCRCRSCGQPTFYHVLASSWRCMACGVACSK